MDDVHSFNLSRRNLLKGFGMGAGALGKLIYSEGEYYHAGVGVLGSYNPTNGKIDAFGWRRALPPMWYPTHSTAYYVSVTGGGRLTEVSCLGMPSTHSVFKDKNQYDNRFGTQVGLFRTSEGGMSRIAMSWDAADAHGEKGRAYGQNPATRTSAAHAPRCPRASRAAATAAHTANSPTTSSRPFS